MGGLTTADDARYPRWYFNPFEESTMAESEANQRQVGGEHYKVGGEEHWDRVARLGLNYFQACATKYIERYNKKGGIQDLEKAQHYLQKLIEIERAKLDKVLPPLESEVRAMPAGYSAIQPPFTREDGKSLLLVDLVRSDGFAFNLSVGEDGAWLGFEMRGRKAQVSLTSIVVSGLGEQNALVRSILVDWLARAQTYYQDAVVVSHGVERGAGAGP